MDDVKQLQHDLENVIKWSKVNNMQLHENKFEFMQHMLSKDAILMKELPFVVYDQLYKTSQGNVMYPVDSVRDLGVKLSNDFSWTPHINQISNRGRQALFWVLSVFKARDHHTMLTLYKSLIRSHLEYCCPLWHPHGSVADTQTLECVQRLFTNKILGYEDMDYWSRLVSLNLMSLQRRRERYIIIYIWKIIHGAVPNDISLSWYFNDRRGIKAHVPRHMQNSILKNSIAVIGPQLWNTLPKDVSMQQSLNSFKSSLQKHLSSFPDRPPTKGYPYSRNSLLDYNLKSKSINSTTRGGQLNLLA